MTTRLNFRAAVAALLFVVCGVGGALAQSNPGLTQGQVPTAGQWNSYFAAKQDVLGYTPPGLSTNNIWTGQNTWTQPQTYSSPPIFATLNGVVYANAGSPLTALQLGVTPYANSPSQIATTAFVMRQAGNFGNFYNAFSTPVTLPSSVIGGTVQVGASGTITLPASPGLFAGDTITFFSGSPISSVTITVQTAGDFIYYPPVPGYGSFTTTSLTMSGYDTLVLMNRGTHEWDVVGGTWGFRQSSPAFTGTPASTTQALGDATTTIATDGFVQNAIATFSGRNRIINGDMTVDQRNGGASGTTVNGYTIDRWAYFATQTGKGTWGQNLNSVGGNSVGFARTLGFQSASAYTVLTTDSFLFAQFIEGFNAQDFQWGLASAQPVTLSFWVNCSLTGTFGGSVSNYANTRSYPFTYSISVANTWTKVTVTIPGDTGGAWASLGSAGFAAIKLGLGVGTTQSGTAGAWATANYASATGAVSVVGTNGATFYFTGVQLEVGSTATPFERQSAQKSSADCMRYHKRIILPASATIFDQTASIASQNMVIPLSFDNMRAIPTLTTTNAFTVVNLTAANPSLQSAATNFGVLTWVATAAARSTVTTNASGTIIDLDAEL